MKIVIAGCGKTGSAIVSCLVEEGHDITVIDSDRAVVEEMTDRFDVMGVCGNAAEIEILREADAGDCRLFAATAESDETNMLACFLAGKLGAGHTIARIRNPEYNDESLGFTCQQLGLSEPLNPDRLAATEIWNVLKFPSAVKIEPFSGRFELIELVIKKEMPVIGMSLVEMRRRYDARFLICAVQRGDQTFIPTGSFVLAEGDRIAVTAVPSEVQKLLRRMGILKKSARSVMIIGAGKACYYLARLLSSSGVSVKVVEKDRDRCAAFADEIGDANVMIINGDGASREVLLEEGLEKTDALVALTGSDEQNIIISIYASSVGVPKVIPKVNRRELAEIAEKLGLDTVISPRKAVTGLLASYARALENSEGSNLEALYHVLDGSAEAIEFKVNGDFRYLGVPLRDVSMRKNVLIAGIIRKGRAIIPSGDESILEGDRVVVISSGLRLGDITDLIEED
ncbi:MAG: Trk system potassium transporter TrkA [Clostridia bacterium]|nr:Trk system potassium transporter TrkA [Clostridia bacterium]